MRPLILEAEMRQLFSKTEQHINEFRATLPENSLTARAIDRNDSWLRIMVAARAEGHELFACYLEEADSSLRGQPLTRAA